MCFTSSFQVVFAQPNDGGPCLGHGGTRGKRHAPPPQRRHVFCCRSWGLRPSCFPSCSSPISPWPRGGLGCSRLPGSPLLGCFHSQGPVPPYSHAFGFGSGVVGNVPFLSRRRSLVGDLVNFSPWSFAACYLQNGCDLQNGLEGQLFVGGEG